jgi:hypothetical protein
MEDEREICLKCGAILRNQVETQRILGVPVPTKRNHCEFCCYFENFRTQSLCERPFKVLMPRPLKSGAVPPAILEEIERYRERCEGVKPLF